MENDWKFKIGDVVAPKAADDVITDKGTYENTKAKVSLSWARTGIVRYMVMEHITQECHGGIQYWNRCKAFDPNGALTNPPMFDFADFELVPFAPSMMVIKDDESK